MLSMSNADKLFAPVHLTLFQIGNQPVRKVEILCFKSLLIFRLFATARRPYIVSAVASLSHLASIFLYDTICVTQRVKVVS